MSQMTFGIILSFITISLPIFPLAEITTLLGAFLILHGLFLVKGLNQSLHNAYQLGIAYLGVRCFSIIVSQYQRDLFTLVSSGIIFVMQAGILYAIFDQIENGMYEMTGTQELAQQIAHAYGKVKKSLIMIILLTLFSTYVVQVAWLGFFVLIALVIVIISNLSPVNLVFTKKGEEVDIDEINRSKDRLILYAITGICLITVLTLVPAVRYLSLLQPLETYDSTVSSAKEDVIIEQMKQAGFPEEIITQLSSEEIANYDGISKAVVQRDAKFSYAEYNDETRDIEKEDLNKLQITFVYSYFNEKAEFPNTVRVLTYGEWKEKPAHTFTDYFTFTADDNMTCEPIVYGIYTTASGEDACYEIKKDDAEEEDLWFGSNPQKYRYTIPTKGSNYRFITAQTIDPDFSSYDQKESNQEVPLYYQLNYYHRVNYPKWMKLGTTDYSDQFYEERQYYIDNE
ncbi:MAG: hypothetical protein Q4G58_05105 [bacterium]|nr:hypothetical protein [bacterium]